MRLKILSLRPKGGEIGPERAELKHKMADLRTVLAGGDVQTNESHPVFHTTGLCPLRSRCPAGDDVKNDRQKYSVLRSKFFDKVNITFYER